MEVPTRNLIGAIRRKLFTNMIGGEGVAEDEVVGRTYRYTMGIG